MEEEEKTCPRRVQSIAETTELMLGQLESLWPSELFKCRMVISLAIFEFLLGPDTVFNSVRVISFTHHSSMM